MNDDNLIKWLLRFLLVLGVIGVVGSVVNKLWTEAIIALFAEVVLVVATIRYEKKGKS